MKKTKLLIPIMGLGATAAAFTPMLVSCGNSKTITGDKIYMPTVKQAESEAQDEKGANSLYLQDINRDNNVFLQDWLYDRSFIASWIKDEQKKHERTEPSIKATYNFKNLKFEKHDIIWSGVKPNVHTGIAVSYEFDGHAFIDAKDSYIVLPGKVDEYGWTFKKIDLQFHVKWTHCPYLVEWKDRPEDYRLSGWHFVFLPDTLGDYLNWSCEMSVDGYYYGEAEAERFVYDHETYNYDQNNMIPYKDLDKVKQMYLVQTFDNIFGGIEYVYHLQNIAAKEK